MTAEQDAEIERFMRHLETNRVRIADQLSRHADTATIVKEYSDVHDQTAVDKNVLNSLVATMFSVPSYEGIL